MFSKMKELHHEWVQVHHFTPSDFESMNALWPIRLGSSIAKPHYHIGPKISPCYYLIGVIEGEGSFIHNGQQYSLKANDLFCLFPQMIHEYYTKPEASLKTVYIAFEGIYCSAMLKRIGLTPSDPHQKNRINAQIYNQFQSLFDQHTSDLKRVSLLYQLFDLLSSSHEQVQTEQKPSSSQSWLQRGKEYIDIHFTDLISIESVAEHVGIERTHFSKNFQKKYGQSPINYLQALRMRKATELLKQSNYKMIEIAHSVGYTDLPTFSKAFKKINGLSPMQYRQQFKLYK